MLNKRVRRKEAFEGITRTEGGRKEVGLAEGMEREDQAKTHPSQGERERETEMETVGGGRGRVRWFGLFPSEFSLCGSVELFLLWKNSLSLCPNFFLRSSLTQIFCQFMFSGVCRRSTAFRIFCLSSLWL